MQGRRSALRLVVDDHARATLSGWLRQQKTPVALATRARALLLVADGHRFAATARQVERRERPGRTWARRFVAHGIAGLSDQTRPGRQPVFSPQVARSVVQRACERPARVGRSRSHWDSTAWARPLGRAGVGASMAPPTVHRMLAHHKRTPWRPQRWWSPTEPRDAVCAPQVNAIVTRYPRPLAPHDMVLRGEETTRLPPRPRKAPTRAAPAGRPVYVAHADSRGGALHLLAAFDPRTGHV